MYGSDVEFAIVVGCFLFAVVLVAQLVEYIVERR